MNDKNLNGFLLIDKNADISSAKALYPVKNHLNKKRRIGHTGTLDPMATGLLVIAIGRATKFIQYLDKEYKEYIAEIFLGAKTDTLDKEGKLIAKKENIKKTEDEINLVLSSFIGKSKQIAPMYSAIKKDGVSLYKLARKGIEVERDFRTIEIFEIELLDISENILKVRVLCSKGTYIRTLAEDIAEKLGTFAYLQNLRRTKSDGFSIVEAVETSKISSLLDISNKLIPVDTALSKYEKINLSKEEFFKISNGQKINYSKKTYSKNKVFKAYLDDEFIGTAQIFEDDYLKIRTLYKIW